MDNDKFIDELADVYVKESAGKVTDALTSGLIGGVGGAGLGALGGGLYGYLTGADAKEKAIRGAGLGGLLGATGGVGYEMMRGLDPETKKRRGKSIAEYLMSALFSGPGSAVTGTALLAGNERRIRGHQTRPFEAPDRHNVNSALSELKHQLAATKGKTNKRNLARATFAMMDANVAKYGVPMPIEGADRTPRLLRRSNKGSADIGDVAATLRTALGRLGHTDIGPDELSFSVTEGGKKQKRQRGFGEAGYHKPIGPKNVKNRLDYSSPEALALGITGRASRPADFGYADSRAGALESRIDAGQQTLDQWRASINEINAARVAAGKPPIEDPAELRRLRGEVGDLMRQRAQVLDASQRRHITPEDVRLARSRSTTQGPEYTAASRVVDNYNKVGPMRHAYRRTLSGVGALLLLRAIYQAATAGDGDD